MEHLSVVVLLLVAAGLQAVTSHPPAPSSCIDFSVYPGQQAVNCLPFANCSGAKCNMTNSSGYASFIIHKCQGPVTVDLSVVTGDSVFHRQFNQTETVSSDQWPHMHIKMSRNATHLHLEVIVLIGDNIMTTLVPSVTVYLNPSVCMCQTLKSVAHVVQPDFAFPYTCVHNTACNGVHCQLSHFNSVLYTMDAVVDPCTQRLCMTICNSEGHVIYQGLLWDSQRVSFEIGNISTRFNANIVHHNHSMDVEMDLIVRLSTPDAIYGVWILHSEWIDLLPRHTIILDQSHCTNTTHTWTSQLSPPSTLYNTSPTNTLGCSQPTSHQGFNLVMVAMVTAVCAVVCLVTIKVGVVMCLVVIGVLMWRQRHRRRCRQYKIRQIVFSDADEEKIWEQLKFMHR